MALFSLGKGGLPPFGLSEALWAARGPRRSPTSSSIMSLGEKPPGSAGLAGTITPAAPACNAAEGSPTHALGFMCTLPGARALALPSPKLSGALGQPPHCSGFPKVNTNV